MWRYWSGCDTVYSTSMSGGQLEMIWPRTLTGMFNYRECMKQMMWERRTTQGYLSRVNSTKWKIKHNSTREKNITWSRIYDNLNGEESVTVAERKVWEERVYKLSGWTFISHSFSSITPSRDGRKNEDIKWGERTKQEWRRGGKE